MRRIVGTPCRASVWVNSPADALERVPTETIAATEPLEAADMVKHLRIINFWLQISDGS